MEGSNHLFFEGAETSPVVPARRIDRRPASNVERQDRADDFYVWLFARAGLSAERYRGRTLSRRLAACLRLLGVGSTRDARRVIEADPTLLGPVLSAALLGVTEFFRDRPVFEMLRSSVVPELTSRDGAVRVWSAACSDGQELYSVAILLSDAGRLDGSDLLGTDCRSDAIERARDGLFSGETLQKFSQVWRTRYFDGVGGAHVRRRAAGLRRRVPARTGDHRRARRGAGRVGTGWGRVAVAGSVAGGDAAPAPGVLATARIPGARGAQRGPNGVRR